MRKTWFAPLLLAALQATASAEAPRPLTLADAVALAMRVDPIVAEAAIAKDRSKLAVLRAQLDRVSLKIDGSLNEQYSYGNIGGPTAVNCTFSSFGGLTLGLGIDQCARSGGTISVGSVNDQTLGLFNLKGDLLVPLFAGGRIDATVKRAQRLDDAAQAQIRQSRHDVALATARAYWSVRRLGLLLEVQQSAIARLREAEAVTQARLDAGLAPPIDRNRATLRRLQTEAALADLAGQLREATVTLQVSLGLDDEIVLVDQPTFPDAAPPDVRAMLDDARSGRPELASARLQLQAQRQAVRQVKAGWYPQIGAEVLFQYGNNLFVPGAGFSSLSSSANPFAGLTGELTLGVGMTYNFFDTLHTWTAYKDAQHEERRLAQEERRASRIVESDVRQAHAKVVHLWTQRAPLAAAVDVARDNAAILEARYKNGDALVIEFLDGEVALVDAERALADVTAQLQLAWLELDAALGRTVGVR